MPAINTLYCSETNCLVELFGIVCKRQICIGKIVKAIPMFTIISGRNSRREGKEGGKEGGGERDRQIDRQTQTDRQTDRQTEKEKESGQNRRNGGNSEM